MITSARCRNVSATGNPSALAVSWAARLACPLAIRLAIFWLQTGHFVETKSNYQHHKTTCRRPQQKIGELLPLPNRALSPVLQAPWTPSWPARQPLRQLLFSRSPMQLRFPESHAPILLARSRFWQFSLRDGFAQRQTGEWIGCVANHANPAH
jgi:hypothetical protein